MIVVVLVNIVILHEIDVLLQNFVMMPSSLYLELYLAMITFIEIFLMIRFESHLDILYLSA